MENIGLPEVLAFVAIALVLFWRFKPENKNVWQEVKNACKYMSQKWAGTAKAAPTPTCDEDDLPLQEGGWYFYLWPFGAYAFVFSICNTLMIRFIDVFSETDGPWLRPISLLAVLPMCYYAHWSLLQFWVLTHINKGAIIKWRWGTRKRIAIQKYAPKAWIFEDVQKEADRTLDNQAIEVTLTMPTMGREGLPGPAYIITATIMRREEGSLSQKTITFNEDALKKGSEALITEAIQNEVAQTLTNNFNKKWPSLKKKLAYVFTGEKFTPTGKPVIDRTTGKPVNEVSRFEDRFGQTCTAAEFKFKPSPALQEIIDAAARGDEVHAQAETIQISGGMKKDANGLPTQEYVISYRAARREAMVIMGLVEEKRFSGKGAKNILHVDDDDDNENDNRRGRGGRNR